MIIQRTDDVADHADAGDLICTEEPSAVACHLTLLLAKWDRQAAIPAIRRRFADYRRYLQSDDGKDQHALAYLRKPLTLLAEAGAQAGDAGVIADYAAWVRALPVREADGLGVSVFLPLWHHPENARLAELARWAFLSANAPIDRRLAVGRNGWRGPLPPLLVVSAFREVLKRELVNVTSLGAVTFDHDTARITMSGLTVNGPRSVLAPDMPLPKAHSQPLRACDKCAYFLSELPGSPRFELYWPEKKRNTACAEIAAYLDRWGPCFQVPSKSFEATCLDFDRPQFRLPRLSRPATPEDVAAGRAIFSLRGRANAQVRIAQMKRLPCIARWKSLKQFPLREPRSLEWPENGPTANHLPQEAFDREGLVWQAEETLVDGRWHCYYGFVGNHTISKVPAEDIEILEHFSAAFPRP